MKIKIISKCFLTTCACLILVGCATNPYIKKPNALFDFRLYGYADTKIQDDIYQVTYTGGTQEMAQDMAMLRAADVTLMNGYKFFTIQDNANSNQTYSSYTPPMTQNYKGHTYLIGGYSTTNELPVVTKTIQCYKTSPVGAKTAVLDAEKAQVNIKQKYHIPDDKDVSDSANRPLQAKGAVSSVDSSNKMSPEDKAAAEHAFDAALNRS